VLDGRTLVRLGNAAASRTASPSRPSSNGGPLARSTSPRQRP
jgi:hypothetical protein